MLFKAKRIPSYPDFHYGKVVVFFIVFYTVGIVGLTIPASFQLFVQLTPLALLLSVAGLAVYHKQYSEKAIVTFAVIYLIGFGIEVIGVNTGLLFGHYTYGNGLGLKLLETPLIIGVNWLLLVYAVNSITERFISKRWIAIVVAGLVLVGYDLILEQVAPKIDMWSWNDKQIPVQNYIAWFVLAVILSAVLRFANIPLKNRLAPVILICQTAFFVILFFTLK